MEYYDSIKGDRGANASKYGQLLKDWLDAEARTRRQCSLDDIAPGALWTCTVNRDATLQENGHACGVHLMMNADLTASGIPLGGAFSSADTEFFRTKIACDILRGCLTYDL